MQKLNINKQNIAPMLLKVAEKPFDNDDYFFELKLDGYRCIAICENDTYLKSRNNFYLNNIFPELNNIHLQCKSPCVLDGEIVYINDKGLPNFHMLQRRKNTKNKHKKNQLQSNHPVTYVAFDVLFLNNKNLTQLPLHERKKILKDLVNENQFLNISRFEEGKGIALYNAAKKNKLEGIVAKHKNSSYHMGKRSDNWLKIKPLTHAEYRKYTKTL